MGMSAGFTMLMSMVRVKVSAVLIGALGVGMMANYNALLAALVTLFGMGVQSSAVREIALAHCNENHEGLAASVLAIKRLCWVLAILGLMATVVMSKKLSVLTFGDPSNAGSVAVLSTVVLLNILNNAYTATIQGARRIGDLARANVWGAVGGTSTTLSFLTVLGIDGIVWALLSVAVAQTMASAFFARSVNLLVITQPWRESMKVAIRILNLGAPLMLSSFAATVTSLVILALITRELSLTSAGYYSAAFALSGVFVGFVLTSMGADYYPRLSSASHEPKLMVRMVNEQTEVGLLLTVPGLLACWVLAPWLVELFYAKTFLLASELLQWFLLGCFGRVISWPMGFVLLAKGYNKTFLFSELTAHTVHIALVWWAIQYDSLASSAIAFFLTYVVYTLLMLWLCRILIGFSWTVSVWRMVLISTIQFLIVATVMILLNKKLGLFAALVVIIFSGLYSVKAIAQMLGPDHPIVQKLLTLPLMAKLIKV